MTVVGLDSTGWKKSVIHAQFDMQPEGNSQKKKLAL